MKDNNEERSMSDNNTGTVGVETENEKGEAKGSYKDIDVPKVNETGFAENEGKHWTANYEEKSVNDEADSGINAVDESLEGNNPAIAKNHVKNVGGTSQEDKYDKESPNGLGI